ncbi:MAG: hypothetical protein ACE5E6_04785 [Phycisphaerae bacterium]
MGPGLAATPHDGLLLYDGATPPYRATLCDGAMLQKLASGLTIMAQVRCDGRDGACGVGVA